MLDVYLRRCGSRYTLFVDNCYGHTLKGSILSLQLLFVFLYSALNISQYNINTFDLGTLT